MADDDAVDGARKSSGSSPKMPATRPMTSPFFTASPDVRCSTHRPPRGARTQTARRERAGMVTCVASGCGWIIPRCAITLSTPLTPQRTDSSSKRSASPASSSSMSTPSPRAMSRNDPGRSGLSITACAPNSIASSRKVSLSGAMRICGRL